MVGEPMRSARAWVAQLAAITTAARTGHDRLTGDAPNVRRYSLLLAGLRLAALLLAALALRSLRLLLRLPEHALQHVSQ